MSESRSTGLRVFFRLAAVVLVVPFIAAPTPGNVGGCGGSMASTPVAPGQFQGTDPPETIEWEYFDRGLCAGVCERLRDCGVLCQVVDPNDFEAGTACENDSPTAFRACMRGHFIAGTADAPYFGGFTECPHRCPPGTTLSAPPLEWDVQVCNDAVTQMACPSGPNDPGSLLGVFNSAPSECLHLCQ